MKVQRETKAEREEREGQERDRQARAAFLAYVREDAGARPATGSMDELLAKRDRARAALAGLSIVTIHGDGATTKETY